MTNDLLGRIYQHKQKEVKGFTKKYNIDKLVYYEECGDVNATIRREKRLKKWNRKWKLEIIEEFNPNWEDLYYKLLQGFDSGSPLKAGMTRENDKRKGWDCKSHIIC